MLSTFLTVKEHTSLRAYRRTIGIVPATALVVEKGLEARRLVLRVTSDAAAAAAERTGFLKISAGTVRISVTEKYIGILFHT